MRRLFWLLMAVAAVAALAWGYRPRPVEVETARVTRGPLRVEVEEEGRTRVRERHDLVAPAAGLLRRVTLKAGDAVQAGQVLAVIDPAPPVPLDPRSRAQAEAAALAAQERVALARAQSARAAADLAFAESERTRVLSLQATGVLAAEARDAAQHARDAAAAAMQAAEAAVRAAEADARQAQAMLGSPATSISPPVELASPVAGTVLRVQRESEGVVAAGQPLLSVGNPADLEIEVDVLSADAVSLRPGAKAELDKWGGPRPLRATVRRVEPSGFTQVSALGVEEQRVLVRLDPEPAPEGVALGDGFRVMCRMTTWEQPSVLRVPLASVFRNGGGWAVFLATTDRAELRAVALGARNADDAEVLEGLAEGDRVVLHPSDRIAAGTLLRVAP